MLLRRALLALPAILAKGQDAPRLVPPIDGLTRHDLRDTFEEERSGKKHEAIDLIVPLGTPVRAVVDGVIRKLFLSRPGGTTIYLFDREERFCYYYAHLDSYRDGLREGESVKAGQVIAYAGSSGNARTPHLHMAVIELESKKQWWKGKYVNPYPLLFAAVKD